MKIIKNQEVDVEKWNHLIKHSPFSSPFQTPDFYHLFNSVKCFSAEVFALEVNSFYNLLIVVTLQKERGIKGFFSRRGIVYGGPLIVDQDSKSYILLLNHIYNYYKSKLIYLEIRNFFNYKIFETDLLSHKWIILPYLNITLSLHGKSFNDILAGMKYNRRREIKLSLERNVIYKECENEKELANLYNILKNIYKTRVKKPLPSIEFFKSFWKSGVGKVFVVMHDNKIIGGSFCSLLQEQAIYTMYYCGLRKDDKKIFSTNIAVIAAIKYALKNEIKYFDFMGAGIEGENYGVRKYKQGFGGKLNDFGRYRKILQPFWFTVGSKGLEILSRLK